jgi:hypothetical protein
MLGAPLGGTTRGGQYGVESKALSLITPPNFPGGGGSCSPLMVVVALGEPGLPVISWADAGRATNIAATAVSSDKPLWINFRFIVFCVLVLVYLGNREKSVRFIEAQRWRNEAAVGERCPDGRQEVGSEPRLNDIAVPARIECGPGEVGVFVDGEKDQARGPVRAPELARGFDAVEPRHGDVEHDQIRMEPLGLSEEFASIAHCTDDQTFAGQRRGRQREHCRMIIS